MGFISMLVAMLALGGLVVWAAVAVVCLLLLGVAFLIGSIAIFIIRAVCIKKAIMVHVASKVFAIILLVLALLILIPIAIILAVTLI